MATISDLHTSLTQLVFEEAFALIRRIRSSRLTKKVTKFTIRMDRYKKKTKVKVDPLKAVDSSVLLELLKESLENG